MSRTRTRSDSGLTTPIFLLLIATCCTGALLLVDARTRQVRSGLELERIASERRSLDERIVRASSRLATDCGPDLLEAYLDELNFNLVPAGRIEPRLAAFIGSGMAAQTMHALMLPMPFAEPAPSEAAVGETR